MDGRQIGEALAQLWQDLGELGGTAPELGAQSVPIALAYVAAEGLHPGPVRGRAARLPAAPDEHARAAGPRVRRSSSARRLLPMPGSPESKKDRPRPANASSRPVTSSASS